MAEKVRQVSRAQVRARYAALERIGAAYNEHNIRMASNVNSPYFAGVDPRRRREMADGGMVREDHNAMANLPTRAIHTEYPDRFAFQQNPYIDDQVCEY